MLRNDIGRDVQTVPDRCADDFIAAALRYGLGPVGNRLLADAHSLGAGFLREENSLDVSFCE